MASVSRAAAAPRTAPEEDGFGEGAFPTARGPATAANPAGTATEEDRPDRVQGPNAEAIDAIRKEGLTGRQLRMARRLAHKHGLAPVSDFDAVRLLRNAGIDPFQRANMLQLVVGEAQDENPSGGRPGLPKVVPETGTAISTEVSDPADRRAEEIGAIQRDIVRRRRRSVLFLAARLVALILLPTVVAGYYFFFVATPMYATQSDFVIQQADGQGAAGLGGLLSGTGMATSQDSITVQRYLGSREALMRLDEDLGFKAHFQDHEIDWWQRLPSDASNEDAYALYQDRVRIGYDPTEGLIRMEVVAATPEDSAAFARALIGYAEDQVDQLTARLRADQMEGANELFAAAEARMFEAQQKVLDLQEKAGVLDPASESNALMSQIAGFETQLAEKRLQLQQLLDNPRPNQARVAGVNGDIQRLEALIADLRSQLTTTTAAGESLARVTGELRMAEVDLETRTMIMQEAMQALEAARSEANRQVRYLAVGVNPVPPDEATYPNALQNTVLVMLVLSGVYLMMSLTVSILREQV